MIVSRSGSGVYGDDAAESKESRNDWRETMPLVTITNTLGSLLKLHMHTCIHVQCTCIYIVHVQAYTNKYKGNHYTIVYMYILCLNTHSTCALHLQCVI